MINIKRSKKVGNIRLDSRLIEAAVLPSTIRDVTQAAVTSSLCEVVDEAPVRFSLN